MRIYFLPVMSKSDFAKEITEIEEIKPDKILVLYTSEQWPEYVCESFIHNIQPYLENNKNVTCTIICVWTPENIKVPNIIFENSAGTLPAGAGRIQLYEDIIRDYNCSQATKLYTCYNRNPVIARAMLVDLLAKENLLNDGIVTFHYPENYQWKYHDGSKLLDEIDFTLNPSESTTGNIYYAYSLPESYCHGFIDIVCETEARPNYTDECYFLSEKSYKPLIVCKPFITLQAQHFHTKYLKEFYGFELYEEMFDYSFDSCENLNDRINGIVENLKRLKSILLNTQAKISIYEKIKDKLVFNKQRLTILANDPNFIIPKSLKFLTENNSEEIYGDVNHELIDHMYDKGWIKHEKIYSRFRV